jgi:nitrous oxide reductase accessory protein NosL
MHSHAGAWERVSYLFSLRSLRLCERHIFFVSMLLISLLFLTACKEEKTTGAAEVRWDREICARCAMAVSDHNYSAQVRGGKPEKKSKLYKFDDVGCAIIWLDDQNWKDDPRTEIWVNHHKTGDWINAKTAWYVEMKNTPMDYGLGAQTEHVEGALNYEQARKHIYKVEERFNLHKGVPLLPTEEKQ